MRLIVYPTGLVIDWSYCHFDRPFDKWPDTGIYYEWEDTFECRVELFLREAVRFKLFSADQAEATMGVRLSAQQLQQLLHQDWLMHRVLDMSCIWHVWSGQGRYVARWKGGRPTQREEARLFKVEAQLKYLANLAMQELEAVVASGMNCFYELQPGGSYQRRHASDRGRDPSYVAQHHPAHPPVPQDHLDHSILRTGDYPASTSSIGTTEQMLMSLVALYRAVFRDMCPPCSLETASAQLFGVESEYHRDFVRIEQSRPAFCKHLSPSHA